jgi:zinc protease
VTFHVRSIAFCAAALITAAVSLAAPAQATNVERVVSPGGIEAWLVREPSVPLVAMDFAFKGGANQDPAIKPGVGYMAAALLDDGAGELDSKAFQQRVAETAVELRFSANRDTFQGSIRMLRDRQDQGFDLLRLSLNEPRFDADAIERVRAQILAGLRRETTNPNSIASRLWWRTAFPDHPYGRPNNGTLESVPLITGEDLKAYSKRVLARDTLKVAVVGDIDAATLGRELDRVFGALPAKADLVTVPPARMDGIGRRIVVDLDVPQTVLSFGGMGIPRKDPDFIPAFVVNHILGGGSFSSRLYNEVREKRGLAYGVSSYLLPLDHAALFMGGTQTRSDRAGEALDIIQAEIGRMASDGPTEQELADAKAYLKGSYALRFDTSTKIAGQLLQIQLDDLGIDYIEKRNSLIDAVTLEDTRRVAKRLASGGLFVTLVGRPKGVSSTTREPGSGGG